MTAVMAKSSKKPRLTREQLSIVRSAAGRAGAAAKHGAKSPAQLEKAKVAAHVQQRLMRATDVYINGQIALAKGVSFLYRIDKKWIPTGNNRGYWRNEKPVLVESQFEIEQYLERLAENNGDVADDQDDGAAYYYITTKEPSVQAIEAGLSRVHGKARETQDVNVQHNFSLVALGKESRELIDANADAREIVDNAPLLED